MRKILLMLCLTTSYCMAADKPAASTAQIAASQHVLVERIARTYAWRLIEPGNHAADEEYASATRQFDHQLATLVDASKRNADLTDNYGLLSQQWADYHTLTNARADAQGAAKVLESSEDMAWIAEKGTQLWMSAGSHDAHSIELTEHVAALSQRLAKIYLLQSAGLKVPFLGKDLMTARAEFQDTAAKLKALPNNTPSISSEINLLEMQWGFFQQALDALAANRSDATLRHNVITTSDRIYEVANSLTERYQRMSGV
jgi:hypothetical protein